MTAKTEKPKPTQYTVRVTNPNKYGIPYPTKSHGELPAGESVKLTIPAAKLSMIQAKRGIEYEILSDNSDQLAAAEKQRGETAKNARQRLDDLKKTLKEAKSSEREIENRLAELEREEKSAGEADLAALKEAGRSEDASASRVLTSAGATAEERQGLTFDLWGAQLRRLDAEAAHAEALSSVAAADARLHRQKIEDAARAVEKAQKDLEAVRQEREGLEAEETRAKHAAKTARQKFTGLEASGPQRVA